MAQKAYFPVPDYDHSPDKFIKIGQIILDLKKPDEPLSPPFLPLPETDSSYKSDWEKERSKALSGSLGIWAKFLAWILTLGGNLSVNFEREDETIFKFKKLETTFIKPSPQYIDDSMAVQDVKDYLQQNPKTSTVFMITGLKIARDAEIKKKGVRGGGGDADISVSAAPLTGAPIEAGPNASLSGRNVDRETSSGSSDFVFAYRLRKITINRKTGQLSSRDEVKGALYGDTITVGGEDEEDSGGEKETESGDDRVVIEFDIFGDDKDFGIDFVPDGFEPEFVKDDDGGDCKLIFRAPETVAQPQVTVNGGLPAEGELPAEEGLLTEGGAPVKGSHTREQISKGF